MVLTKVAERYIIRFLLGKENEQLEKYIFYECPSENNRSKGIYIVPSGFFDKDKYMQKSSLPKQRVTIEDIYALYGDDRININRESVVVYADIVASTFFLITRYEEYVRRDCRDGHGRFIGRESTLYKLGLLQIPVVDFYGRFLRKYLSEIGFSVREEKHVFSQVCLTHDIDDPWLVQRDFFSLAKNIIFDLSAVILNKNRKKHMDRLKIAFRIKRDPYDTFDWLIEMDEKVKRHLKERFMCIYFVMTCDKGKNDYGYIKEWRRAKRLINKLVQSGSEIGIHISYQAGMNPDRIQKECDVFERFRGEKALLSRNHYLMCREPEDMKELIRNGIVDDYSCCFADGAGFRLGTCKSVRWIDPQEMRVTGLTLHPLFMTESKLMHSDYMNLSYEDAKKYLCYQLNVIKDLSGEAVMLFHNTSVTEENEYHLKKLYHEIIDYICEIG